jgi:hypothetical protein
MTTAEAINTIQIAIAEVEWEYPMNYAVAFEMAIEALKGNQWVSVEERLPEEDGRYLVVLRKRKDGEETVETRIMRFLDSAWKYPHFVPEWLNNEIIQVVTHWMPLPEPPAQKGD